MMLPTNLLIGATLAAVLCTGVAIRCFACYGVAACANVQSWQWQQCPTQDAVCYTFYHANFSTWKMGCASGSCSQASGYSSAAACLSCKDDFCNEAASAGGGTNQRVLPSSAVPPYRNFNMTVSTNGSQPNTTAGASTASTTSTTEATSSTERGVQNTETVDYFSTSTVAPIEPDNSNGGQASTRLPLPMPNESNNRNRATAGGGSNLNDHEPVKQADHHEGTSGGSNVGSPPAAAALDEHDQASGYSNRLHEDTP